MLIDRSEQNTKQVGHLDGLPRANIVSFLVGAKEPAPPPQPVMGSFCQLIWHGYHCDWP